MKIIDTHQHFWNMDQFTYSWCKGYPALNRSFLLEDYLAAIQETKIVKTIFMECAVDEPHSLAEARHVQMLSDKHPLISGIVACGHPEKKDFHHELDQLAQLSKLRGIRRILQGQPDELFQNHSFVENIQLLAQYGLVFNLCILAHQLPVAINLVQKCPDVFFILDHCGEPDVKGAAFDRWKTDIKQLSQLPNIACKISSVVDYAENEMRQIIEHVIACFGWDRLVWGGDWPVCTLFTPLKQWQEISFKLFQEASENERQKLFYLNAERIYRV